jgi:hypothetical protein
VRWFTSRVAAARLAAALRRLAAALRVAAARLEAALRWVWVVVAMYFLTPLGGSEVAAIVVFGLGVTLPVPPNTCL